MHIFSSLQKSKYTDLNGKCITLSVNGIISTNNECASSKTKSQTCRLILNAKPWQKHSKSVKLLTDSTLGIAGCMVYQPSKPTGPFGILMQYNMDALLSLGKQGLICPTKKLQRVVDITVQLTNQPTRPWPNQPQLHHIVPGEHST